MTGAVAGPERPVGLIDPDGPIASRPDRAPAAPWLLATEAALVVTLLTGFGAYDVLYRPQPTLVALLDGALLVGVLLFGPRRALGRVIVPGGILVYVAWMLASYTWSAFPASYFTSTAPDLAPIVNVVAFAGLLPIKRFARALITTGWVAIGLILVAVVVRPGLVWNFDGVQGLRGSFIHKNVMAACLIVTAAAALCWGRRVDRWGLGVLTFLILVAGRSTTGQATFVLIVLLWILLNEHDWMRRTFRSSVGTIAVASFILLVATSMLLAGPLVQLTGKDLTFSGRTEIWHGAVAAIGKRPWVGYGWGGAFVDLSREPALSINERIGFVVFHTHNSALEFMIRLGIVGFVLYLVLLVTTMSRGLRRLDEPIGRFTVLLGFLLLTFGFSEITPVIGVWVGLVGALGAMMHPMATRRRALEA